MRCAIALAFGLLLVCPARAETDVFMRAVGFALTGNDDVEPKTIDRSNCVFATGKGIFHLNNVYIDRITIHGWQQRAYSGLEQWVAVSLHGDDVVVEETTEPLKDDGSEIMREMRRTDPSLFQPKHHMLKEHVLRLETSDQDRVRRAWAYIYSHGCVGQKTR